MKKKLLVLGLLAATSISVYSYFSNRNSEIAMSEILKDNIEAFAAINPECPDGCAENGVYCYCYGVYIGYRYALPPY